MAPQNRIETLTQLLRIFDEARAPTRSKTPPERSRDLRLLLRGEITSDEYFCRRIEVSLDRLVPYLDQDDLNYVRHACFEYLRDDLMHSGLFLPLQERLRNDHESGHIRRGADGVNQKENTAKKGAELGSEDLQQLKRGEITVDEYVERQLQRSIERQNLDKLLTAEEVEKLRAIMREDFLDSPVFRHFTDALTNPHRG